MTMMTMIMIMPKSSPCAAGRGGGISSMDSVHNPHSKSEIPRKLLSFAAAAFLGCRGAVATQLEVATRSPKFLGRWFQCSYKAVREGKGREGNSCSKSNQLQIEDTLVVVTKKGWKTRYLPSKAKAKAKAKDKECCESGGERRELTNFRPPPIQITPFLSAHHTLSPFSLYISMYVHMYTPIFITYLFSLFMASLFKDRCYHGEHLWSF